MPQPHPEEIFESEEAILNQELRYLQVPDVGEEAGRFMNRCIHLILASHNIPTGYEMDYEDLVGGFRLLSQLSGGGEEGKLAASVMLTMGGGVMSHDYDVYTGLHSTEWMLYADYGSKIRDLLNHYNLIALSSVKVEIDDGDFYDRYAEYDPEEEKEYEEYNILTAREYNIRGGDKPQGVYFNMTLNLTPPPVFLKVLALAAENQMAMKLDQVVESLHGKVIRDAARTPLQLVEEAGESVRHLAK